MSEAKANQPDPAKSGNGTIYVVDDEPMLLELASVILEPLGYAIQTFRDPEMAVRAFKSAQPRPALIITDYAMHTMNGMQLIEACRQALKRADMTIDQIDLVEINEAFAAQVIPSAKHLGIPMDKLNIHGGAIALGHPFGMTGARIMTTLINGLQTEDKRFGLESMCVGGGQGMAMVIERLG